MPLSRFSPDLFIKLFGILNNYFYIKKDMRHTNTYSKSKKMIEPTQDQIDFSEEIRAAMTWFINKYEISYTELTEEMLEWDFDIDDINKVYYGGTITDDVVAEYMYTWLKSM